MRKVKMPEENTNQVTAPGIPPVDNTALPDNNMPMNNPPMNNAPVNNATMGTGATTPSDPINNVVVDPMTSPEDVKASFAADMPITAEVATKIAESKNVLIALSSDPSVDEMAAAIGLSLFLDKLGKRATAIYSGTTPNALEFLKPEQTFEPTADTLQDFVVALNKDKADHLRYKMDGDYVKIYITPYKTKIAADDLDFSYGDYNVDLVLALDVANGIDLDSALRKHGRIMHDAVIINITTGNPGKFGEIEWSDKKASSVSEMIAKLLYGTSSSDKIGKEEATAFLTGIVAATNRFSNAGTTPETLQIASKLMDSGANQQLVSKNITPDIENEMFSLNNAAPAEEKKEDPAELSIDHKPGDVALKAKEGSKDDAKTDEKNEEPEKAEELAKPEETAKTEESAKAEESKTEESDPESDAMLDDLKAAEESLSHAGAETTPEAEQASVKIDSKNNTSNMDEMSSGTETSAETSVSSEADQRAVEAPAQEKVLTPSDDFGSAPMTLEDETKYGKMLEDALDSVGASDTPAPAAIADAGTEGNPAAMSAPEVASSPEINGVPEMNYMPPSDEQILPPPPTPPIDMSSMMPGEMPSTNPGAAMPVNEPVSAEPSAPAEPAAPVTEPTPEPLGEQPAMQDQVYGPQAADPGAFKIPGM